MLNKPVPLHKPVPLTPLPSFIRDIATHVYFRQSFINDYLLCPQMSLYRWLLHSSSDSTFFSAVLGTAGHAVISEVHSTNNFGMAEDTLSKLFRHYAKQELSKLEHLPTISVRFKSHEDQINRLAGEYVQLLREYCKDKRNQAFHPVINETSFVLELPGNSELGDPITRHSFSQQLMDGTPSQTILPYLFTGTIDYGGYDDSGDFTIRDLKFRESAFKPEGFLLNFNKQLTLYTAGVRYGVPCCEVCRPSYGEHSDYLLDSFNFEPNQGDLGEARKPGVPVVYTGPCDTCRNKIGTNRWPNILPARSELVWMRDYKVYQKDQYKQYIKSKTQKQISPKTGKLVMADIINPKYLEGYKKGQHRGPAILSTSRSVEQLSAFMAEMQLICRSIRMGFFYRREGSHCTSWCRFRDTCLGRGELEVGTGLSTVKEGDDAFTTDFFA